MNLRKKLSFLTASLFLLLPSSRLYPQGANDNPTGPAGMFNGNITTGCSYDPYTGNAMRAVTDLVVAGAVGTQPLAFTRISNSRGDTSSFASKNFGFSGAWRHSYCWELTDEPVHYTGNTQPTKYTVSFPDGRVIRFTPPTDPAVTVPSVGETCFRADATRGVSERFQKLDSQNNTYLILTDGSKVRFHATVVTNLTQPPTNSRIYKATALIDPYGLETTLTYDQNDRLSTVQEPGGKSITLYYATTPWFDNDLSNTVLDRITASDGRTVQYIYSHMIYAGSATYTILQQVGYFPLSSSTYEYLANYTYKAPNVVPLTGHPLLASCDDPMYEGPMKKISYAYVSTSGAAYGELFGEKYSNTSTFVSKYQWVVDLLWPQPHPVETRGDDATRNIIYASWPYIGHILIRYSPFGQGVGVSIPGESSLSYDNSNYVGSFQDGNSHTTDMTREPVTGRITVLTHPPDIHNIRSSIRYYYTSVLNPYYLDHVEDERNGSGDGLNHTITYHRNSDHTIYEIDYPDGGYETFHYLQPFKLVDSHRMTNGYTETFEYYGSSDPVVARRNLKKSWTNGAGKKTSYDYDSFGRLSAVTDPRGAPLDPQYTTNFEYNTRGQLTITRHPPEPGTTTRYFIENHYNSYGSLETVKDELSNVTTYTYDDYQRLTSVTPPIRGGIDDTSPHTTRYYYDRAYNDLSFQTNPIADYRHTDSNVTVSKLPSGKMQLTKYDNNLRKTDVIVGSGAEQATTHYDYDLVGNLHYFKDARHQQTTVQTEYFYDARNRLIGMNDPIPTDRDTDSGNSPHHTVTYDYDQAGNKISELRANNQKITYDSYDEMNRLKQQTVPITSSPNLVAVTKWDWKHSGKLLSMTDPRGKQYTYEYDGLNRKTKTTYPAPYDEPQYPPTEQWSYDLAGNLDTYTNRNGDVQTHRYDNRNRETYSYWTCQPWTNFTPDVSKTYDAAGRLFSMLTPYSADSYTYYNDNSLKSETQQVTPYSSPMSVIYKYDSDGNRSSLTYPSDGGVTYGYTSRNQLQTISQGQPIVTYAYHLTGDPSSRTVENGTSTGYTPDDAERALIIKHSIGDPTDPQSVNIASLTYHYTSVGTRDSRTESAAGLPTIVDTYAYDFADGVKNVKYNFHSNTQDRNVDYVHDASGNRTSVSDSVGGPTIYSQGHSNLNEYESVTGQPPTGLRYGANGELWNPLGWELYYDAQARLVDAVTTDGINEITFTYDPKNRCISRSFVTYGHIGGGMGVLSTTATNYYYDGWNLLEEQDDYNGLQASYIHGAKTDEIIRRTDVNPLYYHQDGLGNVVALTDSDGSVVERYSYDVYGAPKFKNASGGVLAASAYGNNFLFTGREYIALLGMYDYRNRVYWPKIGRFIQPDPIGFEGDPNNLYRYCGNNAVNGTDPTGRRADEYPERIEGGFPDIQIPAYPTENPFLRWVLGPKIDLIYDFPDVGVLQPEPVGGITSQPYDGPQPYTIIGGQPYDQNGSAIPTPLLPPTQQIPYWFGERWSPMNGDGYPTLSEAGPGTMCGWLPVSVSNPQAGPPSITLGDWHNCFPGSLVGSFAPPVTLASPTGPNVFSGGYTTATGGTTMVGGGGITPGGSGGIPVSALSNNLY
jgi:RHS repeat-associated protein